MDKEEEAESSGKLYLIRRKTLESTSTFKRFSYSIFEWIGMEREKPHRCQLH